MNIAALPIAGFLGLGAPELLIVFLILLLLFGGAKLPSLAKGLGQSIKEFKKAAKEDAPEDSVKKTEESASKDESQKAKHGSN